MVNGIEIFRTFFKDYSDKYILIGGAACDAHLAEAGLIFRATKDLDIILIVEALDSEFVKQFWKFVENGGYETQQKSEREKKYYRFMKPAKEEFPFQLELFARKPDFLYLAEESHLTPIPVAEDTSSLSAILLDDDYYSFTIENSEIAGDLARATVETLICLKAKVFLDMKDRKEKGERIDKRDIRKHKNDVIRLTTLLTGSNLISLPDSILQDMYIFVHELETVPPDVNVIAKNMGIPGLKVDEIINQIKTTFRL